MKYFTAWVSASVGSMLVAGAAYAAVAPVAPTPEDGNTYDVWVGDGQVYDDNVYRVPNTTDVSTPLTPDATRADSYNLSSFGVQGQYLLGRQQFELQARADYSAWVHNTSLDNLSYDVNPVWTWRLGSPLSGQAGVELSRYLVSFSEVRFDAKDLVQNNLYFVNGQYQLGPHWSILGDYHKVTSEHSSEVLSFNNFRAYTMVGGLEYITEVDDTFTLKYTYYSGRYPDNIAFGCENSIPGITPIISGNCTPIFLNSNYIEHFPQLWVKYAISDKTLFNGNIGHLKRDYTTSVSGSFTGIIWRVRFDWQTTEKLSFGARAWHEVHAYDVAAADYFISTGGSIAPNYALTPKIVLSGILSYEKQHYIENSASEDFYGIYGQRNDKIYAEQLNLQYTPTQRWIANFFYRHEHRLSTLATSPGIFPFQYGDNSANVSISYKFF